MADSQIRTIKSGILLFVIVMCSTINRSHPIAIIMGVRLARFCFIARWATALAIGSSVAHAEIERSANLNKGSAAFKRTVAVPICVAQLAYQEGKIMNENEIIANLNPKLGKVLARLVRTQEHFPIHEKGEPDHAGKPPIGMMPTAKQPIAKSIDTPVSAPESVSLSQQV